MVFMVLDIQHWFRSRKRMIVPNLLEWPLNEFTWRLQVDGRKILTSEFSGYSFRYNEFRSTTATPSFIHPKTVVYLPSMQSASFPSTARLKKFASRNKLINLNHLTLHQCLGVNHLPTRSRQQLPPHHSHSSDSLPYYLPSFAKLLMGSSVGWKGLWKGAILQQKKLISVKARGRKNFSVMNWTSRKYQFCSSLLAAKYYVPIRKY